MRKTLHLQLSVPMDERVRLLREDYAHLADNPMAMVERLSPLKSLVGGEELALWQSLAEDGQVDELCRRVLQYHYDPSYRRFEAALAQRVRNDHRAAGDGSGELGQRRRGIDDALRSLHRAVAVQVRGDPYAVGPAKPRKPAWMLAFRGESQWRILLNSIPIGFDFWGIRGWRRRTFSAAASTR